MSLKKIFIVVTPTATVKVFFVALPPVSRRRIQTAVMPCLCRKLYLYIRSQDWAIMIQLERTVYGSSCSSQQTGKPV